VLSTFDAIFMRNIRIYFDPVRARSLFAEAHQVLNDGGYLVLGKIESVSLSMRHLFETVDPINRIYRKKVL